jgi:hypothetical protein
MYVSNVHSLPKIDLTNASAATNNVCADAQTMSRADIEAELQARGVMPVGAKSELKVQMQTALLPAVHLSMGLSTRQLSTHADA